MNAKLIAVPVEATEGVEPYVEVAPSFEAFYETTYRRLFTALCLVTCDRYEAEEIAQEAFVRVFERWDRVGGLDDPTGYLFRVAMNVFRGRYRRASLALRRSLSLAPAVTDDLAAVEAQDEVVRLLSGLNPSATRRGRAHGDLGLLGRRGGPLAGARCVLGPLPHHAGPCPPQAGGNGSA